MTSLQAFPAHTIIAESSAFRHVLALAERVAPTMLPTLIEGPTGTGKEVLAQFIHRQGRHSSSPFIDVNCGAIPDNLFESELFGHVKGAFTGAVGNRVGYMELTGNGTLFLDEIGEMPLSVQPKLLRALETRTFRPVGSDENRPFRGRVLAATHCDLQGRVKERSFREDLYYRISVLSVTIPPLCERREDIAPLIRHFSAVCGRNIVFDAEAMAFMETYGWPGNIRELKNFVDRMAVLSDDPLIRLETVRQHLQPQSATDGKRFDDLADMILSHPAGDKLAMAETVLIDRALELCKGNKTAAARLLGVDRKVVERRQRKAKDVQQETRHLLKRGRVHVEKGDFRQALTLLEKALLRLPDMPLTAEEQRLLCDICHLLCIAHQGIEGWLSADALRYNEKAMQLARRIEDDTVLSAQLFWSWASQLMSLDIRKARATAQEMLFRAQNMKDRRLIDEAFVALANTLFWFGDCQETLSCLAASGLLEDSERDCAAPHGLDLLGLTIMFKGLASFQLGLFDEAHAAMERLQRRGTDETVQAFYRALSLQGAAWIACLFEEFDVVETAAGELVSVAGKHGFTFFYGIGVFFQGCVQAAQGHYGEAERLMREGYEKHMLFQGGKLFHSFQAWKRADLLLRMKRLKEADALVLRAIEVSIEHQERVYLAELMELQARIQLALGHAEEAQQGFASALSAALAVGTIPAKIRAARQIVRFHANGEETKRLFKSVGLSRSFARRAFLPPALACDLRTLFAAYA